MSESDPMAERKLKTVTRTQGNNKALKEGAVKPRTFTFDFEEVEPLIAAFRRMVRDVESSGQRAAATFLRERKADDSYPRLPGARLPSRRHSGQYKGRHSRA
jgi:4,5-dihydroxyphthalate decarboxylase